MTHIFATLALGIALAVQPATAQQSDQLLRSAKAAWPGASVSELSSNLQSGIWRQDKAALAACKTTCHIFIRQADGSFIAVDVSGVEGQNLGKLGVRERKDYSRVETHPIRWLSRRDGLLQVEMRTYAWLSGQRYSSTEYLLLRPDGTVLWR